MKHWGEPANAWGRKASDVFALGSVVVSRHFSIRKSGQREWMYLENLTPARNLNASNTIKTTSPVGIRKVVLCVVILIGNVRLTLYYGTCWSLAPYRFLMVEARGTKSECVEHPGFGEKPSPLLRWASFFSGVETCKTLGVTITELRSIS